MSTPGDGSTRKAGGEPAPGRAADPRSSQLREVAETMSAVTRWVDAAGGHLDGLAEATLERMPGAEGVSVSLLERGHFTTQASTHDWARDADDLQYELGHGPCVEAVLDEGVYASGDVASDPRWPDWGARVLADHGIHSVLANRLVLHGDRPALASLNVYSRTRDAFDEEAVHLGVLLAAHGSLLVSALMARDAADHLAEALKTNREVGVAMGVLMHRHRLTRDEAFDLLRVASQTAARPLVEIATEVVEAGDVPFDGDPLDPRPGPGQRPSDLPPGD